MGANASCIDSRKDGLNNESLKRKLEDIPEACVALVLSYLDPPEICKLARINRVFRAASSADFIWESKLPSNYRYLLEEVLGMNVAGMHKKDIFARLSKTNSFDGGTREMWIDKNNGGVCLAISSKGMTITGIDDRRYWNHIPTEESRFQTVAYLQQMWWLEVDGDLEFQFPAGTYSLFFRLQLGRVAKRLGRRICNTDHVHGWDLKPVQFQLTMPNGQRAISRCYLDNVGTWTHHHVGDFVVEDPTVVTKIKFSLIQIDCTHTKGGLCVDSVFVCPISLGKELRSFNSLIVTK
ncbi:F-box protein PP2-A13-like [Nicotiana tabacum]|uniref:F-box protein PP2-A13-like n=2 Tax=Nicotiana TaxID=4085 RepID=A0A1S4DC56_TOBAC|nr:PREDICTED: F-box protein PP2-A13-like [Nicotiana sylvestris]XP_016510799.1 PREDICTED: F-box protein PP2-A13-like [Nicotiana tabacum]